jgi:hypothetical protein
LSINKGTLPIDTIEKDVLAFLTETTDSPELVVCMGDTLTHFTGYDEVLKVIAKISRVLPKRGKLVVSWRDLSKERKGADRFLQVRSDDDRTLTCFLEYFPTHAVVHDILIEKTSGTWTQTVSTYPKLRIAVPVFRKTLRDHAIAIVNEEVVRGMTYIVGEKI